MALAAGGLLLLVSATPLWAQGGFVFGQRGGAALTTGDFGDADLGVGYGFEGSMGYRFFERTAVYAGWSWFRFNADDSFAGADVEVDEVGFAFGVRYEIPVTLGAPADLRLHGGLGPTDVELDRDDGSRVASSGYTLGWRAGAGLAFYPGGGRWSVGPALHYRFVSPDFLLGGVPVETDLDHLSLSLGFSWRL